MNRQFTAVFESSPVISAVRDLAHLPLALSAPSRVIFLLSSNLTSIAKVADAMQAAGKDAFVHFDMIDGLGKDVHGLRWLVKNVKVAGIMTTRAPLISHARSLGLVTIQRMFLLDSQSVQTGIALAKEAKPDFLEVMPGNVPDTLRELVKLVTCPLIAGGLIKTVSQCKSVLEAGAIAISTSDKSLWQYTHAKEVNKPVKLGL